MDRARIRLDGARRFVGIDEGGHTVVMDSPSQYGGDGSGIRPVELILHALAACSGMDVISILEKKRQDVREFEILVEADQRVDDFPKIYTSVRVEYVVTGYGVSEEAVRRAVELSEEKYCSVLGMLRDEVVVETSVRVIEAREPGVPLKAVEE